MGDGIRKTRDGKEYGGNPLGKPGMAAIPPDTGGAIMRSIASVTPRLQIDGGVSLYRGMGISVRNLADLQWGGG